ncbi:MAG: type I restriction endonuclease subunit R [Neisseriaceae bacterium]|nr:type I restriction endonuclease subunit R [Neisseriaceae bacterium]
MFINGIPLVIIEVKKPNNKDGMKAEYSRMNRRLQESSFRRFFNLFQLLIVSNNQEYENDDPEHLIGAYYATHAKRHYRFNHFREELQSEYIDHIADIDHHIEDVIISDSKQLESLKNDAEYQTNIDKNSPTNKIISGLLYPKRLQFLLLHGMVYVEEDSNGVKEIQKHIMRYPQLFAAKKTLQMLQNGKRKGVIWHTQGSGKTAFAFYCVNILTQYFAQQGIVPKFYFIVDRIDLTNQAAREFGKRGLKTYKINSRQDLNADFKTNIATRSGEKEICIVNIQKFSEDTKQENISGYNTHIQRIFFIDEAHRSYNMAGSFLPNLYNADEQSIKIALTSTPIIIPSNRSGSLKNLDKVSTKQIFGDYIHKYYYNASIDDGYTLKLMREKIKTTYQETIQKNIQHISQELQIKTGEIKAEEIHQHPHYAQPLLDYVVEDLHNSRLILDNQSIGGMLVCVNNNQAALLYRLFLEKYHNNPQSSVQSAILVLDDSENITHSNKNQDIEDYKQGKIDLLIVNKMLLTGFDCPRLKKLYLDRKIKAHNLLQALTRVNRPYQDFRYGYIVDFANIEEEFNRTNQAYLLELKQAHQGFLDEDEEDVWNSIFISEDEKV